MTIRTFGHGCHTQHPVQGSSRVVAGGRRPYLGGGSNMVQRNGLRHVTSDATAPVTGW